MRIGAKRLHSMRRPPPRRSNWSRLEQLRFLNEGVSVRMIEIPDPPGGMWEVNNPSDIVIVEAALAARHLV
jgi:3-deoxy-manno-octulosonate cytidylyltransferase (CMP-KDO synthetase)